MAEFATGGFVSGDGPMFATLHKGDYIISPTAARKYGKELLDRLNETKGEEPDSV